MGLSLDKSDYRTSAFGASEQARGSIQQGTQSMENVQRDRREKFGNRPLGRATFLRSLFSMTSADTL
jgi:hypothetical protein